MSDNLNTIVEGRVFDGILFATPRDRGLYIGTLVRNRPQWLKQNPDKWRRKEDVQRETASLATSVKSEIDVGTAPFGPSGQTSSHDLRNDDNAEDSADTIATASPPAEKDLATAALSLSEIAKNEIAIGSDVLVSNRRLASMLGVSERTLSRLLASGNAPPHVKVAGNYYALDKAQEWAAAKGLLLNTSLDNHH